jgi:hypothetical protein
VRHLAYALPDADRPARLVLMESNSTEIVTYIAVRSFMHIERDGRTFRLSGRDRATEELVYLPPKVAIVSALASRAIVPTPPGAMTLDGTAGTTAPTEPHSPSGQPDDHHLAGGTPGPAVQSQQKTG